MWRKKIFLLPSGSFGKKFITETTRLLELWNNDSEPMKDIAIKAMMITPALLLQKPGFKSKSKEHSECLQRRINTWDQGDFDSLVREARIIQTKLPTGKQQEQPDKLQNHLQN